MTYTCDCKCHRTCHTCGRPFRGPYDYHINCADTPSGQQGIYTPPDPMTPWADSVELREDNK